VAFSKKFTTRIVIVVILLTGMAFVSGPVHAQQRTLLGVPIKPISGTYLVVKDANVRAKPETKGKRLTSIKNGERVTVVGKSGNWLATTKDGKDFGFIFASVLLPMIDGALDKDYSGTVEMKSHSPCGYTFRFSGKNVIEGEIYEFADYEIQYRCNRKGKPYRFLSPMFMTEVPYKLTPVGVYQISIDILEVDDAYDEIFSTTFLYQRDKNRIIFDSVSNKKLGRPPEVTERKANSIAEALAAAVELAPSSWGDKVWKQISKSLLDGEN
jgi:hypothetical protein